MISTRAGSSPLCLASLFVLAWASPTYAGGALPEGAAAWMALDRCAAYGAGFASVDNTTCVKVGGHVRVEFWTHSYDASGVVRAQEVGTSALAEPRHLRVSNGEDFSYDPFVEPASSPVRAAQ